MESAELMVQKKLRTELIQLEDSLSQTRREYEMLRIEFEQNLAANEQTGPINREMRHLITSLQNHNQQLKGEVSRYKRKLMEAQNELTRIKAGEEGGKEKSGKEKGETTSTSSTASGQFIFELRERNCVYLCDLFVSRVSYSIENRLCLSKF